MELENFICDICGQPHELCFCGGIDSWDVEERDLPCTEEVEEAFPKITGDTVEIMDRVFISKKEYNKNFF